MHVRLVTFLGIGAPDPPHYKACQYKEDGEVSSQPSPLHDVATVELLLRRSPGATVHIAVLGTKEVQQRWFGSDGLYRRLVDGSAIGAAVLGHAVTIQFVLLPDGATDSERWEIFTLMTDALRPSWSTASSPSVAAPDEIVVDITHGFRSQSFFAAAAIAFAQSQQAREQASPVPIRIIYGAFEAKTKDAQPQDDVVAPVWDLTQLLNVSRWDRALDGLMRFGRADDLAQLIDQVERTVPNARARDERAPLKMLRDRVKEFADALVTGRTGAILTDLAEKLVGACESAKPVVEARIPPLVAQLNHLQEWVRPLKAKHVVSVDGVRAALALAGLYERLHRFSELSAILRETLTTSFGISTGSASQLQPPDAGFDKEREGVDRSLGALASQHKDSTWGAAFHRITSLRNDVQHAAFNQTSQRASSLITKLAEARSKLEVLLKEPAVFVSCTNHELTPQQCAAVQDHCPGAQVLELPFPLVTTDADAAAIGRMAEELVAHILKSRVCAVHLAGEQTLTHAVVAQLQGAGIPTYASTTERDATEDLLPDGSVTKTSRFRFVGFRLFPQIGRSANQ